MLERAARRGVATAAVFEPASRPTTVEETVERLGTAIKLGLLPPGHRLPPERDLAEQFQLARSTLRQALTILVQSGHVVSTRGRHGGTFVAEAPPRPADHSPPVATQLRDVLDHRLAVETGAVVLAAERATSADFERLSRLVDEMAGAVSFHEYRSADAAFHLALAEATRSGRLLAAMTDVQSEMGELLALIPQPQAMLARSNAQHRRMVSVLARRDAASATRLMRDHLAGSEHILIGLLPRECLAEGPAPDRRRR